MSSWVVMFPADDEAEWEAGSQADHEAVWAVDQEFARLLAERGGAITVVRTRCRPGSPAGRGASPLR